MELRQLRYFVEIADRGSFTAAAETLAIAQPALTAQIQKLEAELNARLFVRSRRGVELTDVGRAVIDEARRTLDAADAVSRSALLATEAAGARLIVGFTRIFPFLPIARTIRRMRRERPNVRIDLREMASAEQMDELVSGALDVGFVYYGDGDEDRDLAIVPVAEESLVVAVPDNHRFATRRQIALAELADEEFLIPSEAVLGSVRAFLIDLCKRAGFTPRITEQPSDFRLLLGLVSAGVGVTMLASSARDLKVRGVHYISIVPPIVMRFGAMYRRGATAKFLAPFLERIER